MKHNPIKAVGIGLFLEPSHTLIQRSLFVTRTGKWNQRNAHQFWNHDHHDLRNEVLSCPHLSEEDKQVFLRNAGFEASNLRGFWLKEANCNLAVTADGKRLLHGDEVHMGVKRISLLAYLERHAVTFGAMLRGINAFHENARRRFGRRLVIVSDNVATDVGRLNEKLAVSKYPRLQMTLDNQFTVPHDIRQQILAMVGGLPTESWTYSILPRFYATFGINPDDNPEHYTHSPDDDASHVAWLWGKLVQAKQRQRALRLTYQARVC